MKYGWRRIMAKYAMKNNLVNMDASLRKIKTVFEDELLLLTHGSVMNNVRDKIAVVDHAVLRRMGERLSIINMILNCREFQMTPFFSPSEEAGAPGFVIHKKGQYNKRIKSNDKKA